jgi:hypothetical protein
LRLPLSSTSASMLTVNTGHCISRAKLDAWEAAPPAYVSADAHEGERGLPRAAWTQDARAVGERDAVIERGGVMHVAGDDFAPRVSAQSEHTSSAHESKFEMPDGPGVVTRGRVVREPWERWRKEPRLCYSYC